MDVEVLASPGYCEGMWGPFKVILESYIVQCPADSNLLYYASFQVKNTCNMESSKIETQETWELDIGQIISSAWSSVSSLEKGMGFGVRVPVLLDSWKLPISIAQYCLWDCETSTVTLTVQMRKWRLWEVKWPTEGHGAQRAGRGVKLSFFPENPHLRCVDWGRSTCTCHSHTALPLLPSFMHRPHQLPSAAPQLPWKLG